MLLEPNPQRHKPVAPPATLKAERAEVWQATPMSLNGDSALLTFGFKPSGATMSTMKAHTTEPGVSTKSRTGSRGAVKSYTQSSCAFGNFQGKDYEPRNKAIGLILQRPPQVLQENKVTS